jgi:hypothetical protein
VPLQVQVVPLPPSSLEPPKVALKVPKAVQEREEAARKEITARRSINAPPTGPPPVIAQELSAQKAPSRQPGPGSGEQARSGPAAAAALRDEEGVRGRGRSRSVSPEVSRGKSGSPWQQVRDVFLCTSPALSLI